MVDEQQAKPKGRKLWHRIKAAAISDGRKLVELGKIAAEGVVKVVGFTVFIVACLGLTLLPNLLIYAGAGPVLWALVLGCVPVAIAGWLRDKKMNAKIVKENPKRLVSTRSASPKQPAVPLVEPKPSADPKPGTSVAGHGVYMGTWKPKDNSGQCLGVSLKLYAAPEDLTDSGGQKLLSSYWRAAGELTVKKDWHGHDGGTFANDDALYAAIAKGTYAGEWFIPPRELVTGADQAGQTIRPDQNLCDLKAKGDLAGTLVTVKGSCDSKGCSPAIYWSSTEMEGDAQGVWGVNLWNGEDICFGKPAGRGSCRPMRAEPS